MRKLGAAAIILIVLASSIAGGWLFVFAVQSACHQQQKQYDTLHQVITAAFTPLRPPKPPLTAAQKRDIEGYLQRMYAAQGDRPSC